MTCMEVDKMLKEFVKKVAVPVGGAAFLAAVF